MNTKSRSPAPSAFERGGRPPGGRDPSVVRRGEACILAVVAVAVWSVGLFVSGLLSVPASFSGKPQEDLERFEALAPLLSGVDHIDYLMDLGPRSEGPATRKARDRGQRLKLRFVLAPVAVTRVSSLEIVRRRAREGALSRIVWDGEFSASLSDLVAAVESSLPPGETVRVDRASDDLAVVMVAGREP